MLLTLALRPIYYVGQVVYYELNIDYIIETYCINKEKPELKCNGKCHLAKQLEFVSKTNTNDEVGFNLVSCFYPVYHVSYPNISFKKVLFKGDTKTPFSYQKEYFFTHISKHFKPPTA